MLWTRVNIKIRDKREQKKMNEKGKRNRKKAGVDEVSTSYTSAFSTNAASFSTLAKCLFPKELDLFSLSK